MQIKVLKKTLKTNKNISFFIDYSMNGVPLAVILCCRLKSLSSKSEVSHHDMVVF